MRNQQQYRPKYAAILCLIALYLICSRYEPRVTVTRQSTIDTTAPTTLTIKEQIAALIKTDPDDVESTENDIGSAEPPSLKVAWLMSFPNSGTTYTISLISKITNMFTASTYGFESEEAIGESNVPIVENGPFWIHHDLNATYPTRYVMVKTHCGARSSYNTQDNFQKGCLMNNKKRTTVDANSTYISRNRMRQPRKERTWLAPEHVKKVIHLIRNPYDNVVSRFRFERRHPEYRLFNATPQGFLDYCDYTVNYTMEYEKYVYADYLTILQDVPCKWDFLRYFNWHNRAFATAANMQLETLVVKYDEYTTDFAGTVSKLLNFLQMKPVGTVEPFIDGKVYTDYFTAEQRLAVKKVYLAFATQAARSYMESYFAEVEE